MVSNDLLVQQAAAYKREARKDFEAALAALIALAFRYKSMGENFLWSADPELEAEANRICRNLSDTCASKAKARAVAVMDECLDYFDGEAAWDFIAEPTSNESLLTRFDMAGSHLLELLEIWIALAFVNGMTKTYLKIEILRYLANPYASPLWKGLSGVLKWGPGYMKDIAAQLALIGQDAIIGAVRRAEWLDAMAKGATFWIWRRGSNFKCEDCQERAGQAFPIDIPFSEMHARCMCWPEYHYE